MPNPLHQVKCGAGATGSPPHQHRILISSRAAALCYNRAHPRGCPLPILIMEATDVQTPQSTLEYLDQQDEKLSFLAQEIWAHPEIALEERFASKLLADELEAA